MVFALMCHSYSQPARAFVFILSVLFQETQTQDVMKMIGVLSLATLNHQYDDKRYGNNEITIALKNVFPWDIIPKYI